MRSSDEEPWVCDSSLCLYAQDGKQGWAFCIFLETLFRYSFKNIDIFNGWLKPKDSSKIQIKSIYSVRIISIAKRVFRNPIRSNLTESTVVLGIKPSTPIGKIAATIGSRRLRAMIVWKKKNVMTIPIHKRVKHLRKNTTTLNVPTMSAAPTPRKRFKIFGIKKDFHNISRILNRSFKARAPALCFVYSIRSLPWWTDFAETLQIS